MFKMLNMGLFQWPTFYLIGRAGPWLDVVFKTSKATRGREGMDLE